MTEEPTMPVRPFIAYPGSIEVNAVGASTPDSPAPDTTTNTDTTMPKPNDKAHIKDTDSDSDKSEPIAATPETKSEDEAPEPKTDFNVGRPEDPKEHIRNQLLALFDREDLGVADKKTQAAALMRTWTEFGATAAVGEAKTSEDGESQRVTRRYSFLPVRPKTTLSTTTDGARVADVYDTFKTTE